MPRYFFNQVQDGGRIEDPEGSELSSVEEAHKEAMAGAIEIMADRLWQGKEPNHSKFEICNEEGTILMVVSFGEVLRSLPDTRSKADKLR